MPESLAMPAKNPFPGIPALMTEKDLLRTVAALVEVVELLTGQRGTDTSRQAALRSYVDGNFTEIEKRLKALEP